MTYDIIVIGAGASGMMAAAAAAKCGAKTAIIEASDRIGRKILVTGNGKCNLTNMNISEECYRCDSLEPYSGTSPIMKVIDRFDNNSVIGFFKAEGMLVRVREGYVYPYSEQAASVLDTLKRSLEKYGVDIFCPAHIEKLIRNGKSGARFKITGDIGKAASLEADKIIIATGSAAGQKKTDCSFGYRQAKEWGHTIIRPLPALVQLVCKEGFFKDISGVRAKGRIELYIDGRPAAHDSGEIQFTDYGISGIPVFQISRYAVRALEKSDVQAEGGRRNADVRAVIDLMPEYGVDELEGYIAAQLSGMPNRKAEELLTGLVNKKLISLIIRLCGQKPEAVAHMLKKFSVTIVKSKELEAAQVAQGGIPLCEVNLETMESKLVKGVFFCGEILDVDGICGGYNLQWAWSSGYLAGTTAAEG